MSRKAIDAVMSVILLILLVITFTAAAWYFINRTQGGMQSSTEENTQRQEEIMSSSLSIDSAYAKEIYVRNIGSTTLKTFDFYVNEEKIQLASPPQKLLPGETQILYSTMDVKKGDWIKIASDYGIIINYRVERTKTGRCGNGRCDFPSEESCVSCSSECGRCEDGVAVRTYPKNLRLNQQINIEAVITAKFTPEFVVARMNLPNGTTEEIPLIQSGNTWTATRTADQIGVYLTIIRTKEQNGPFLPDFGAGMVSTADWGSPDWRNRKPIFSSEAVGYSRKSEYMIETYQGLTLATGSCNEIKITDSLGKQMPHQVISGGSGQCEVAATFNAMADISNQVIGYIYYNNAVSTAPVLPSDLLPYDAAAGCLENTGVKLCLGKTPNDGGIMFLSSELTGKGLNLLQTHTADSKLFRSGIQPQVDYKEGFDMLWCSNYTPLGPPVLKVSGPIYQKVEYPFGTNCAGTDYQYRYTVEMFAGESTYQLQVDAITPISMTQNGGTVIPSVNWNPAVIIMTSDGVTCTGERCFHWTDLYRSPQQMGIGAVMIKAAPNTMYGTLSPPNSFLISDAQDIPADTMISKTKTLFSNRDDIYGEIEVQNAVIRSPLSAYFRLGDEETYGG
jgi:hypothetical protein